MRINYENILLIDDDKDDQGFFQEVVKEISPASLIYVCNSGSEGLQLNSVKKPSVIFLDLNMPVMDGFECFRKIREQKDLLNIPIIIFTTSCSGYDINKSKEIGTQFLSKASDTDSYKAKLVKIWQSDSSDDFVCL